MAEDAVLQGSQNDEKLQGDRLLADNGRVSQQTSKEKHDQNGDSESGGGLPYKIQKDGSLTLSKDHLPAYEEIVFTIITGNNGKLRFVDLLELVGGTPHKNILYKALASLARQGRIERIRGIGKKRIEFYYYDAKKIKRPPPSASVSFVR
jgi:hypothetical protein